MHKGATQEGALVRSAAFAICLGGETARASCVSPAQFRQRARDAAAEHFCSLQATGWRRSIASLLLLARRQSRAGISTQRCFCCREDETGRASSSSCAQFCPRGRDGAPAQQNVLKATRRRSAPRSTLQSTSIDPPIGPQPTLDRPQPIKTQCGEENSLAQQNKGATRSPLKF